MRLHFIRFDVEESKDCDYDVVEIHDGIKAEVISTLCGDSLPDDIISSGNTVFVYFTSDETRNHAGFRIQYSATNGKRNVFMFILCVCCLSCA